MGSEDNVSESIISDWVEAYAKVGGAIGSSMPLFDASDCCVNKADRAAPVHGLIEEMMAKSCFNDCDFVEFENQC
jgi:hypothetical protein